MLFRRTRQHIWYRYKAFKKLTRMWFPSPAEVKFVRIMGGKALTFKRITSRRNKFPLTFMWLGFFLNREFAEREHRVGPYYLDFAFVTPFYKKGIEIDGREYHQNIVVEQEREDYLNKRGWQILHIEAPELYQTPYNIFLRVQKFLED